MYIYIYHIYIPVVYVIAPRLALGLCLLAPLLPGKLPGDKQKPKGSVENAPSSPQLERAGIPSKSH